MWWVVNATPRPIYPPVNNQYTFYRRLGGPQGQSGEVRSISVPPGFDIRTIQSAGSHYAH